MSQPLAAPAALEHAALPWLQAAAVASLLPHAGQLPPWLTFGCAVLLAWSLTQAMRQGQLPPRWLLLPLVGIAATGIALEYRSLFGRDPGIALLVAMATLKLLELRSRRDAMVLLTLSCFLLLTHFLHSQSIPTALWLLLALWLIVAALLRLQTSVLPPRALLREAARLCLQAIPLTLLLFILFPRISGPLWGLPQDAQRARSGLAEQIEPGSIADLALSGEIAFRVRFDETPPPRRLLYWRGPVLELLQGNAWRPLLASRQAPRIEATGPTLTYESTLEASRQHWLLALDAPGAWPADAELTPSLSLRSREPLHERQRVRLAAHLDYRFNREASPGELQRNLRLPGDSNPRSQALGREWQERIASPRERVVQALQLFAQAPFAYTLQPPILGQHAIDDFLFTTRRGFCEHYAAAFALLMRAAGVPARVVSGYQGGELNPVDGYFEVRQSDAHAWTEVWLAGEGWQRVDPTAAVAPERIERGIVAALPLGEPLPLLAALRTDWLLALRHRWDAANNAWNQYFIGYNAERQRQWLAAVGVATSDWRRWALLLTGGGSLLLAGLALRLLWHRPRRDPLRQEWERALRILARHQVHCQPGEAPLALLARVNQEMPARAPAFAQVVQVYLAARYGPPSPPTAAVTAARQLRAAVAQLAKGNRF
ncbi:DUF3488 and transglutaminase-like domain-containing protein [Dechloromonas sp. ZY10]|uniref:transglutaminase TgpA family protein n=1 Tax=Dechloromonas aquae TaxID=2664436 RepID=UPI003528E69C